MNTEQTSENIFTYVNIFNLAKYLSSGTFQNYLVFIAARKYIKYCSSTTRIDSWKSNGISERTLKI